MNINAIDSQVLDHIQPISSQLTNAPDSANFADWLGQEISDTNSLINTAEHNLQQLALGKSDNLHHVMLSLEQAKTAFELTLEVRNKLLEAYQEVMRMQI